MPTSGVHKYRNLTVIAGGLCPLRGRRRGRRTKTAAEMVLERRVRDCFNALQGSAGTRPSEAIQKICERVQMPLGVFGRRIVEAHSAGCSHDSVRAIGVEIVRWIDQLFAPSDDTVTERVFFQGPRLVA